MSKFQSFLPLFLGICLTATTSLSAQKNADCYKAFDACKKQTYKFDRVGGIGTNEYEAEMVPCFMNSDKGGDAEMNSTWIKLTIKKGGSLAFAITPNDMTHDFDFVVYRLPSNGDCEGKQIVRCMASGDPDFTGPCMGQTGLRSDEKDSSEDAGCGDEGDNAWLAPLRTAAGEQYAILVSNVTASGPGFSISITGSAVLPCEEPKEKDKPAVAVAEPAKKPQVAVLKPEPKAEEVVVKNEKPNTLTAPPASLGDRKVDVKEDNVRVTGNKIRVTMWDDGIEDGDIVSVYVNEEKVLNKIALKKKARIFNFTLPKGEKEHYFTIFSDSFGKIEPNTATLRIEDGTNTYVVKLVSTKSKQQSVKIVVAE
jgi:hypothetical protein